VKSYPRRGVKWHFNPKRAPWFGGFWEWLIGLNKSTLKEVLGRTHATLDGLQTTIVEAEAILDNRPLTYVSCDAKDIEPITSSQLLLGRPIVSIPHCDVESDEQRLLTQDEVLRFMHCCFHISGTDGNQST